MPHQMPDVLAYLRYHLPCVDWVSLARNPLTTDALAQHIAADHDLTVVEAQAFLEEAEMATKRPSATLPRAA